MRIRRWKNQKQMMKMNGLVVLQTRKPFSWKIKYCSNLNLTFQDDTCTSLGKLCWMLKMQKQLAVLEVTLTVLENEELDFLSLQIKDHLNPRRQTQKSTRVKKVCHTSISPTAAVIKTANLRFKWTFLKLVIQSLFNHFRVISNEAITVQKMKFSVQDFFRECDQIRRKLQIWSHLVTFHIRLLYITIFTFH